ncbi:2-keto-3-deoxy-L-rhamnonate aldolase, partial [Cupriavidus basilensis]|nr:2-keto-3-deoxy-L-rhamnonate aldolase [Cupriavidus basilensis]
TIVASGKAAGTLTSDPKLARRYLELGCTFVATGVDVLVYAGAARRLAADFIATGAAPAATGPCAAY